MHAPEPRLPGVSVREAAIQLGTSESDIRRRIKRGELAAESFERPGGTLLRVLLPAPSDTAPSENEPRQAAPEPHQDLSAAITAAIEPYVAMNHRIMELYQGAAETIAALEREAGAATTRAGLLEFIREENRAELKRLRDELAEARTKLERPWWRRWW